MIPTPTDAVGRQLLPFSRLLAPAPHSQPYTPTPVPPGATYLDLSDLLARHVPTPLFSHAVRHISHYYAHTPSPCAMSAATFVSLESFEGGPSSKSAATSVSLDSEGGPSPKVAIKEAPSFDLCCPICTTTPFSLKKMPTNLQKLPEADIDDDLLSDCVSEGLKCNCCGRTFQSDNKYVDLTLTSGFKSKVYSRKEWGGTELFRSPLISFVYERGWRQGFSWAGFPGEAKEYDYAMDYLKPAYGDVVVDMSCGSGLFTRRFIKSGKFFSVVAANFSGSMLEQNTELFIKSGKFSGVLADNFSESMLEQNTELHANIGTCTTHNPPTCPLHPFIKSGKFSGVVAADFSESMLEQTAAFLKEDKTIAASASSSTSNVPPYLLLRADIARLPFPSGSVSAIHAGAAIHCWPNPQAALAEISRVLKPGGVFVASTFMGPSVPWATLAEISRVLKPGGVFVASTFMGPSVPWATLADISRVLKPGGVFAASTFMGPSVPWAALAEISRVLKPGGVFVASTFMGPSVPWAALAEISRVLKPGGVFVASTFMVPSAPLGQALGSDDMVRPLNDVLPNFPAGVGSEQYKWWQEDELRDLCDSVGLEGFERQRTWRFIMFCVRKPMPTERS
eukprot:gene21013-27874_t